MTNTHAQKKLAQQITAFADERNWHQYHSPKNLAMALSVEVAELVEIFQWLTQDESRSPDEKTRSHIEQEIGDLMKYLTAIAAKFGIDPVSAGLKKMEINAKKYPADRVRGRADKYTTY